MEIFKWMEWIVARNEALSEVGRPDDELVGFGYVHLVEDIGAIHVPHDTKVGARIAVDMGESLGIIFDGRASGTHHFVAVYGLFAKEESLQQVLHAISPA
ncbi:hypothetical protein PC121_g11506 [Phytophthora cactorum]|nr:hypothetical protein PC121_g11506 [Phytophthora cactorum]